MTRRGDFHIDQIKTRIPIPRQGAQVDCCVHSKKTVAVGLVIKQPLADPAVRHDGGLEADEWLGDVEAAFVFHRVCRGAALALGFGGNV